MREKESHMPGSFAIKQQQSDIKRQLYLTTTGGYNTFEGVIGNVGIGIRAEKPLGNKLIGHANGEIVTGKTSGLKTEWGFEVPFSDKGAVDVSVYSGLGNRYADSRLPESGDNVNTNPTTSNWQVNAYENHLVYGGGVSSNLKFTNKNGRVTFTVGLKGGYQGAYNTEGKKEGASYDLQNESGLFAGIQAGGEFRIENDLSFKLNAERRYTQKGAYNGITGGLIWYF